MTIDRAKLAALSESIEASGSAGVVVFDVEIARELVLLAERADYLERRVVELEGDLAVARAGLPRSP